MIAAALSFSIAIAVGVLLGAAHMALLLRAIERILLRERSASLVLLTAPARLALPAVGLLAATWFGGAALAGGLVGYVAAVQAARWRFAWRGGRAR